MSARHLVDANALIALVVTDHEFHERAARWSVGVGEFAVCPVVEGALVRYMTRVGAGATAGVQVLEGLRATGRCEFWVDAVSYTDADLRHVVGHRQVTDAYLVSLARSKDAQLATFDASLVRTVGSGVQLIE
jgi:toxin-antitoxin system PIN domain toxin